MSTYNETASGGLGCNSSAALVFKLIPSLSGGIAITGSLTTSYKANLSISGGIKIDGAAVAGGGSTSFSSSGGCQLGGVSRVNYHQFVACVSNSFCCNKQGKKWQFRYPKTFQNRVSSSPGAYVPAITVCIQNLD